MVTMLNTNLYKNGYPSYLKSIIASIYKVYEWVT